MDSLLDSSFSTLGVVPIVAAPLAIYVPIVLAAFGSFLVSLTKPATLKAIGRTLWRNKVIVIAIVLAIVGLFQLKSYLWRVMGRGKGAAVQGTVAWTAFRGGPDRRGANPGDPDPVSGGPVWNFARDYKTFYSSPAYAGGSIFVASANKGVFADEGAIYRLDAATGAVIWKFAPKGFRATFSSPSVSSNYVVCGEGLHFTTDARIFCMTTEKGDPVWEFRTKSHVESSPCIYSNKMYVGAGDDGFYCIELAPSKDGKPVIKWHADSSRYKDCEACPIAADGRVYFCLGMAGMAIICCDAETGKEIWKRPAPYPVFGNPTLVGDRLFVGMGNGNFIETAEQVRIKELDKLKKKGASEKEIAEADEQLKKVNGEVWCLDAKTGEVVWTQKVGRAILGSIAHADGRLYVGSCDGAVTCFTVDGKLVKSWNANEPIKVSPAVGSNVVYAVTDSGKVYGLDRTTMKPIWDTRAGNGGLFLSSPAVGGGHLYVGTDGNGLMCLGRPSGEQEERVWNGFLGGPGQTGWADKTPAPAGGKFAWRFPAEDPDESATSAVVKVSAPVAVNTNAIYVGLYEARNGLVSLGTSKDRRKAPAEQWFFATSNGVYSSAAFRGGKVYVVDGKPGDKDRKLYCLAAADGRQVWSMPVEDAASGDLCLLEQGILVAAAGGTLSMIEYGDAAKIRWRAGEPGWLLRGMPVENDGIIVVASESDSSVMGLSVVNGGVLWKTVLASKVKTGPVSEGATVAVGTDAGVTALSLCTGAEKWAAACGAVTAPLTADNRNIVCATDKPAVVVLSWDGQEARRVEGAVAKLGALLCGDSIISFMPEALQSVDLLSGKTSVWLARTGWMGVPTSPAVMVDGHMLFATSGKGLVCFGPK